MTFRVAVRRDGKDAALLTHTVTTPYRWEPRVVDLAEFGGQEVSLSLSIAAEKPGTIAFWGAPAVRQRAADDAGGPPRTVILIQGDTLRKDHLDLYGYGRATGPDPQAPGRGGRLLRQRHHPDELDEGGDAVGARLALPVHPRRPPDPRPPSGLGHHHRRGLPGRRVRDGFVRVGGLHRRVHQPAPGLRGRARGRVHRRTRGPARGQDGARVHRPPGRVAGDAPRRPVLRLPPFLRPPPALRAEPPVRHALGRSQGPRGIPASAGGPEEVRGRSVPGPARDGHAGRADEGRPRPGGVHPVLEGLV